MVKNEAKFHRVKTIRLLIFPLFFTISLTTKKRCDITCLTVEKIEGFLDMSKRRLSNLLKRKFLSLKKFVSTKKGEENWWIKNQLKEFSRLGGELVKMKMVGRVF